MRPVQACWLHYLPHRASDNQEIRYLLSDNQVAKKGCRYIFNMCGEICWWVPRDVGRRAGRGVHSTCTLDERRSPTPHVRRPRRAVCPAPAYAAYSYKAQRARSSEHTLGFEKQPPRFDLLNLTHVIHERKGSLLYLIIFCTLVDKERQMPCYSNTYDYTALQGLSSLARRPRRAHRRAMILTRGRGQRASHGCA